MIVIKVESFQFNGVFVRKIESDCNAVLEYRNMTGWSTEVKVKGKKYTFDRFLRLDEVEDFTKEKSKKEG